MQVIVSTHQTFIMPVFTFPPMCKPNASACWMSSRPPGEVGQEIEVAVVAAEEQVQVHDSQQHDRQQHEV